MRVSLLVVVADAAQAEPVPLSAPVAQEQASVLALEVSARELAASRLAQVARLAELAQQASPCD